MKTAIVTGGTKGIGAGVVRMLVGKGYRVIATYAHDDEAARRLEEELRGSVAFFKADHTRREDTYRFVEFVRKNAKAINCVVCNAGVTLRKSFLDMPDEDWDAMMEICVNAHVIILRELYSLIEQQSRIIFTSSAMANYPHATVVGYGVAKTAVQGLVRNLVKVFEAKETTVNAVAPGFVETDWHKGKPEQIRRNIYDKTAIHRFATVEETVEAYAFLIDNGYVNGSVLEINGGYSYK